MILSAERVTKTYGTQQVLIDCSLSVSAGECVLLSGPSGAGKSTLLRILALLDQADAGTIRHGETTKLAAVKSSEPAYPFLTVVFQQLFLWPNLTMAENLSVAFTHRPHSRLSQEALEMLKRFGIEHTVNRLPHECSLGERQRLALSRALLSRAQFLLLDEPSSALDQASKKVLVNELTAALGQERGVLIVSHDLEGFAFLASQLVELENGRLRGKRVSALPRMAADTGSQS